MSASSIGTPSPVISQDSTEGIKKRGTESSAVTPELRKKKFNPFERRLGTTVTLQFCTFASVQTLANLQTTCLYFRDLNLLFERVVRPIMWRQANGSYFFEKVTPLSPITPLAISCEPLLEAETKASSSDSETKAAVDLAETGLCYEEPALKYFECEEPATERINAILRECTFPENELNSQILATTHMQELIDLWSKPDGIFHVLNVDTTAMQLERLEEALKGDPDFFEKYTPFCTLKSTLNDTIRAKFAQFSYPEIEQTLHYYRVMSSFTPSTNTFFKTEFTPLNSQKFRQFYSKLSLSCIKNLIASRSFWFDCRSTLNECVLDAPNPDPSLLHYSLHLRIEEFIFKRHTDFTQHNPEVSFAQQGELNDALKKTLAAFPPAPLKNSAAKKCCKGLRFIREIEKKHKECADELPILADIKESLIERLSNLIPSLDADDLRDIIACEIGRFLPHEDLMSIHQHIQQRLSKSDQKVWFKQLCKTIFKNSHLTDKADVLEFTTFTLRFIEGTGVGLHWELLTNIIAFCASHRLKDLRIFQAVAHLVPLRSEKIIDQAKRGFDPSLRLAKFFGAYAKANVSCFECAVKLIETMQLPAEQPLSEENFAIAQIATMYFWSIFDTLHKAQIARYMKALAKLQFITLDLAGEIEVLKDLKSIKAALSGHLSATELILLQYDSFSSFVEWLRMPHP